MIKHYFMIFVRCIVIIFVLFSANLFVLSNKYYNFAEWIGESCKLPDKGKLTTLPRFSSCQHELLNVSKMLKYEDLPEVNSERWLSTEDLEGEAWRDVPDYIGLYKISNYGRVKSVPKKVPTKRGYLLEIKEEKILKAAICYGYCRYGFTKNGTTIKTSAHRMEARAFIPNVNNKPFIDHIDGNKMNNCLYNLRWCTASENMRNEITVQKLSEASKGRVMPKETRRKISEQKVGKNMCGENPSAKRVLQFDKHGNFLKEWSCAAEAARELGFNFRNISACCNGKKHTHRGYIWRFSSNDVENIKQ